jgi:hypothetical protein
MQQEATAVRARQERLQGTTTLAPAQKSENQAGEEQIKESGNHDCNDTYRSKQQQGKKQGKNCPKASNLKQAKRCRLCAIAQSAQQGPEPRSATAGARASPRPAPVAIRITPAHYILARRQKSKTRRPNGGENGVHLVDWGAAEEAAAAAAAAVGRVTGSDPDACKWCETKCAEKHVSARQH